MLNFSQMSEGMKLNNIFVHLKKHTRMKGETFLGAAKVDILNLKCKRLKVTY